MNQTTIVYNKRSTIQDNSNNTSRQERLTRRHINMGSSQTADNSYQTASTSTTPSILSSQESIGVTRLQPQYFK